MEDLVEDGEMRLKRQGMARDSQEWRKIVLEGKVHDCSALRRKKIERI
jgi:hypothetical protein